MPISLCLPCNSSSLWLNLLPQDRTLRLPCYSWDQTNTPNTHCCVLRDLLTPSIIKTLQSSYQFNFTRLLNSHLNGHFCCGYGVFDTSEYECLRTGSLLAKYLPSESASDHDCSTFTAHVVSYAWGRWTFEVSSNVYGLLYN